MSALADATVSLNNRLPARRERLGFETAEIAERPGLPADNCRRPLHRARMGSRGGMQPRWIQARAPAQDLP